MNPRYIDALVWSLVALLITVSDSIAGMAVRTTFALPFRAVHLIDTETLNAIAIWHLI